jgi:hypothetical protein
MINCHYLFPDLQSAAKVFHVAYLLIEAHMRLCCFFFRFKSCCNLTPKSFDVELNQPSTLPSYRRYGYSAKVGPI